MEVLQRHASAQLRVRAKYEEIGSPGRDFTPLLRAAAGCRMYRKRWNVHVIYQRWEARTPEWEEATIVTAAKHGVPVRPWLCVSRLMRRSNR